MYSDDKTKQCCVASPPWTPSQNTVILSICLGFWKDAAGLTLTM